MYILLQTRGYKTIIELSLKISVANCPESWVHGSFFQINHTSSLMENVFRLSVFEMKDKNIIIPWQVKRRVRAWKEIPRRRVEQSFNPKEQTGVEGGKVSNNIYFSTFFKQESKVD